MKNGRIIALCMTFLSLGVIGNAQTVSQTAAPEDNESLRRMLVNQPNYTARQQFVFSEGFGGFGANSKVAKMGNRQVEVTEDTIFIHERGKPTIKVFPKRKEYAEMSVIKSNLFPTSPEELAVRNDVTFKSLGTEKVGKHGCMKIEVAYKHEKLKEIRFLFWAAPELKNLVIKSEIFLGLQVRFLTVLEDITLSVDEELFRVPAGYKKVVEPDYMKELQERIRKPH